MATYTQNYTLHQWEDTDDFLRTDFNEDFAKIDTALGAIAASASTAQTASESNAYNIYNLILQNYYESKYTGYKSALLFDGFMDSSNVATLGDGLYVNTSAGQMELNNVGQQTVTDENYGNTRTLSYYSSNYGVSISMNTTGYGTLDEFRVYMTGTATYTCYVSSVIIATGTISGSSYSTPCTISLNRAVEPGTSCSVYLSYTSTAGVVFYGSSASSSLMPGGEFVFTPTSTSQSSFTLPTAELGSYSQVIAWANFNEASIAFSINGEDMTQTSQQDSTTLEGTTCVESTHALDITGAGDTIVTITLNALDDSQTNLYDYGIVFL